MKVWYNDIKIYNHSFRFFFTSLSPFSFICLSHFYHINLSIILFVFLFLLTHPINPLHFCDGYSDIWRIVILHQILGSYMCALYDSFICLTSISELSFDFSLMFYLFGLGKCIFNQHDQSFYIFKKHLDFISSL